MVFTLSARRACCAVCAAPQGQHKPGVHPHHQEIGFGPLFSFGLLIFMLSFACCALSPRAVGLPLLNSISPRWHHQGQLPCRGFLVGQEDWTGATPAFGESQDRCCKHCPGHRQDQGTSKPGVGPAYAWSATSCSQIYGARVKVDSLSQLATMEKAEKEKVQNR